MNMITTIDPNLENAMRIAHLFVSVVLVSSMAACSQSPDEQSAMQSAGESGHMVVYKTPWCGCCTAWAEQAEEAGFSVELRDVRDLGPIRQMVGVPPSQGACHTAIIDGYFVEGHVPFDDVKRMLDERPEALGIAVPGMPLGSPGMEADVHDPYSVNLVTQRGVIEVYAEYEGDAR